MTEREMPLKPQIKLFQATDQPEVREITHDVSFTVPTVLLLPGANGRESEQAEKQIKEIDWLLGTRGVAKEQFQLIGMQYAGFDDHFEKEQTLSLNMHGRTGPVEVPQCYKKFVQDYLLPLVKENNVEQTKKNFRNLNIVSYSYGSAAAQFLAQELEQGLQGKGFSRQDSEDVLSQVMQLSFAPTADVSKGPHFTSYHVMNLNDKDASSSAMTQLARLRMRTKGFKEGIAFVPGEKDQYFLCANRHNLQIINNKHGSFIESKEDNAPGIIDDIVSHRQTEGHGLKDYLRYSIERNPSLARYDKAGAPEENSKPLFAHHGLILPLAARTLLANAVSNSIENILSDELIPLPKPEKLIQHASPDAFTINNEEALGMYGAPGKMEHGINYNERIAALVANPAPQMNRL